MADRDSQDWLSSWGARGVHSDAPAGGSGPGVSRLPGPGSDFLLSGAPTTDAPSARHFDGIPEPPLVPQMVAAHEEPLTGRVPMSLGLGSVTRIPIPGTNGLAIELSPRGWQPKGGSTSSLFFQDVSGKRHLRLDLGYNKNSGVKEWHWNQKGVADVFGIQNHTSAGSAERALGQTARYYRYAGRVLLVAGVVADGYSIVTASNPLRRSVQVISAWSAAFAGCETVGAGGAWLGTFVAPGLGTAIGGFAGCAIGAFLGYTAAEGVAGHLYDWAEETVFSPLAPESVPEEFKGAGGSSGGGGASGSW